MIGDKFGGMRYSAREVGGTNTKRQMARVRAKYKRDQRRNRRILGKQFMREAMNDNLSPEPSDVEFIGAENDIIQWDWIDDYGYEDCSCSDCCDIRNHVANLVLLRGKVHFTNP